MDSHRLADDPLHVWEVLDLVVGGDTGGHGVVEFFLEFLQHARRADHVVEERAGGVGGGVGTGDELRQGFGRQLFAAEFLALGILAFHQACEEIHTVGVGVFESLGHTGNRDTGKVLNRFHALAEELVWEVLCVGLQLWKATQCARDLTTTVEDFNGRGGLWLCIGCLANLGEVTLMLQHTKGGSERQVANDVESEVVEPVQGIDAGVAGFGVLAVLGHVGPFAGEKFQVAVDVLLELADGFGAEGVRNHFAFASMLGSVTRVEETSSDRDKGIIVLAVFLNQCQYSRLVEIVTEHEVVGVLPFQESVAMSIDGLDGIDVGNGHMMRLYPHHLAKVFM